MGKFFYGAQVKDPQFMANPSSKTDDPNITANYGLVTGPISSDFINPVPIPLNKSDFDIIKIRNNLYLNELEGLK